MVSIGFDQVEYKNLAAASGRSRVLTARSLDADGDLGVKDGTSGLESLLGCIGRLPDVAAPWFPPPLDGLELLKFSFSASRVQGFINIKASSSI
ncbi:hypothetical protein Taro_011617 [Colocasia esculenta]|uniref:Uncharacterized protein n=1 Tax=Colocasia esculenta TaxID=4460 RepID=A0A843UGM0_COLES|nr:hypothetical protein [Colocasia esculenta]